MARLLGTIVSLPSRRAGTAKTQEVLVSSEDGPSALPQCGNAGKSGGGSHRGTAAKTPVEASGAKPAAMTPQDGHNGRDGKSGLCGVRGEAVVLGPFQDAK